MAPAGSNWVTKQFVDYVIVETQDDEGATIREEKKRWKFSSAMPPLQQIAILEEHRAHEEPSRESKDMYPWAYQQASKCVFLGF